MTLEVEPWLELLTTGLQTAIKWHSMECRTAKNDTGKASSALLVT